MDDQPHRKAEELVDGPHPFAVAAGQVVVYRNYMRPLAAQAVQVGGHRRHQRLPLTGLHLGNASLVQDNAAEDLDIIGAHPHGALRRFPHQGKGFREQLFQAFTQAQPLFQAGGPLRKISPGQRLHLPLQGIDLFHYFPQAAHLSFVGAAKDLLQEPGHWAHLFSSFNSDLKKGTPRFLMRSLILP